MRAPMFALVLLAVGCGGPQVVEHPPPGTLDSIAWLRGTWHARRDGGATDEIWTRTGERTWMGLNVTTNEGATAHHEVLRIEAFEDGVRYVAAPAGQSTTAFGLVRASEGDARFENPAHDFPTWIRYLRHGRQLTATIGGSADSESEPAATWDFQRSGDAPALVDVPARLCRDGSTLRVEVQPCQCGGEIFCAGFETDEGLDVHLAMLDHGCDACTPTEGSCALPGGPIARINGRPVRVDEDGCVGPEVPMLAVVDL
ncbi:MAG: hypothetical protein KC619_33340 [Myxococcales bacterium]|nr:hypothetical protein [Myxococcales bacterium]